VTGTDVEILTEIDEIVTEIVEMGEIVIAEAVIAGIAIDEIGIADEIGAEVATVKGSEVVAMVNKVVAKRKMTADDEMTKIVGGVGRVVPEMRKKTYRDTK
jgi:hypothetical protein